ncbi:hypothetical protein [Sphingomonas sp.]|uniref:hypothetical protein n=1 Tax=Sphingomonas sp. TaxID=28214 RepID=UPI003B009ADB
MAAVVFVRCVLSWLAIAALWSIPADAQRRPPDQDRAREAMRMGARPLRDIQQQWRQGMPGYDYLGSDYDANAGNYRLKFLRDGSVSWVDVDGRTGREVGRSGH